MAFQLNTFSTTGVAASILNSLGSANLRIFPSAVTFPTDPVNNVASLPGGHILSYTGLTYTRANATISITAGNVTQATTAAGNLTWWSLSNGNNVIVCDSISVSGDTGMVVVSTMTPTSGQLVTVTMNMTVL
jgi:hypothetical protein